MLGLIFCLLPARATRILCLDSRVQPLVSQLPGWLSGDGAPPTGRKSKERRVRLRALNLQANRASFKSRGLLEPEAPQRNDTHAFYPFPTSPPPIILGKKTQRKGNGNVPLKNAGSGRDFVCVEERRDRAPFCLSSQV